MRIFLLFLAVMALASVFSSSHAFAQGGPPLVTDDPGTPGDGHWEINVAGIAQVAAHSTLLQAPYADINYGWGADIQLKIETGYTTITTDGQAASQSITKGGGGTTLAGVKWRILDEETSGFAFSTYPQVDFHNFYSSIDPDINAAGSDYILPFEFSWTSGKFEFNPEVGYIYATGDVAKWIYGMVFGYVFEEDREALVELHGLSRIGRDDRESILNFGTRYAFNKDLSLLLALGHTMTHFSDDEAYTLAYLGLQIRQ
jgi:hypothetical protein